MLASRQYFSYCFELAVAFVLRSRPLVVTASTALGIRIYVVHHLHIGGRVHGRFCACAVWGGCFCQSLRWPQRGRLLSTRSPICGPNIQVEPGFGGQNSKEVKKAIVHCFLCTQRDIMAVRGDSLFYLCPSLIDCHLHWSCLINQCPIDRFNGHISQCT